MYVLYTYLGYMNSKWKMHQLSRRCYLPLTELLSPFCQIILLKEVLTQKPVAFRHVFIAISLALLDIGFKRVLTIFLSFEGL